MAGVFTAVDGYHVWGMWVSPELRGQGVGRALLDRLLAWTESKELGRSVCLEVNPDQETAVRLYEGRGFKSTSKISPLGHHAPAVIQEMRLDPKSVSLSNTSNRKPRRTGV